ncbi:MAG: hypothetical protein IPO21_09090 [Bacteroidales bacterium]|nr:hypothetical protein [Bacteroidales bacterium]
MPEKQKNNSKSNLLKSELAEKSKLDSTLSNHFEPDGKCTDSEKTIFTYNAKGKDSIETIYYYSSETEKWYCLGKYETFYDANGNVNEIKYSLEEEGKFTEHLKYTSEFDSKNRLIKITNYQWDLDSSEWIVSEGESFTYDENGNLTQEEFFRSDYYSKSVYTYNEIGKKVESIDYWKIQDGDWTESSRDSSTYDLNGK